MFEFAAMEVFITLWILGNITNMFLFVDWLMDKREWDIFKNRVAIYGEHRTVQRYIIDSINNLLISLIFGPFYTWYLISVRK